MGSSITDALSQLTAPSSTSTSSTNTTSTTDSTSSIPEPVSKKPRGVAPKAPELSAEEVLARDATTYIAEVRTYMRVTVGPTATGVYVRQCVMNCVFLRLAASYFAESELLSGRVSS